MSGKLSGKVAIVTGGARGQGASHVRAMVREGARVACTDVRVELGKALAAELGDAAMFIQHDVSKPQDWEPSPACSACSGTMCRPAVAAMIGAGGRKVAMRARI
jgi:NAD(P)-dependent dehydrogenase (short-subunit alcohol dehydrogenase family)